MEKIYTGKTKDIYKSEDGNYILKFKDDVTGENGVFDPGANTVGLSIEGVGHEGLKITKYFFEILKEKGIRTHYIDCDLNENTMTVKPCEVFGKGIEVICRFKAVGSFIRRYGLYAKPNDDLDTYVEITLKDDERCDPLITKDALVMLNILTEKEYEDLVALTKEICTIIRDVLKEKGLTLYDIKLEFGKVDGEVVLIDEISGGNMRVYNGDKIVAPTDLYSLSLTFNSSYFIERICVAKIPAFSAPSIATVATGTPLGIWTVESRASNPSSVEALTGTPITGTVEIPAKTPAKWAALPANAIINSILFSSILLTKSIAKSNERCAEITLASYSISNFFKISQVFLAISLSEILPIIIATFIFTSKLF